MRGSLKFCRLLSTARSSLLSLDVLSQQSLMYSAAADSPVLNKCGINCNIWHRSWFSSNAKHHSGHPWTPDSPPGSFLHGLPSSGAGEGEGPLNQPKEERSVEEAFQELIGTAFQLAQNGRPAEAEQLLMDGAHHAGALLGEDSLEVSVLWDQLALLYFIEGKFEDAITSAEKAIKILQFNKDSIGMSSVAAIRKGAALLGAAKYSEAEKILKDCIDRIQRTMHELEDEEDDTLVAEAIHKLDIALAEATYYWNIVQVHELGKSEEALLHAMVESLQGLNEKLGSQHPLIACALRAHNKIGQSAVDKGDLERAEDLHTMELKLQEAAGVPADLIAVHCYDLGTLRYCLGKSQAAVDVLQRSYDLAISEMNAEQDSIVPLKHRLAMALADIGEHTKARKLFEEVSEGLEDVFGPDNPIALETQIMTGLMELRQGQSEQKDTIISEMKESLHKLKKFGENHMLVVRAGQLMQACVYL